MPILKFLGVGNAFSNKSSNTSAYFVQEDELFLLDCGESVFHEFKKLDLKNKKFTILLTHFHSDHTGSLGSLVFYLRNNGVDKENIRVFHPETIKIKNLLDLFDLWEDCTLIDNLQYAFNNKIEFFKQRHYKSFSYGYLIKLNNKTIYFSGDTCEVNEKVLEKFLKSEIDELYIDTCLNDSFGYHLTLDALMEIFPIEYRHKIYCMHLPDELNDDKILKNNFNIVIRRGER